MKNWKKRIFSPRTFSTSTVIVILAIIALAFTVIACSEEDDPYGSIPSAPKGVMCTILTDNSCIISWTGVPGALQYFVYQYITGGYGYSSIGVVTEAAYGNQAYSYTYTIDTKDRSKLRFYVSAVNSHGWSELSKEASVTSGDHLRPGSGSSGSSGGSSDAKYE